MTSFRISHCEVGPGCPVFCIAEIGLAHEGSLGQAHAYIDAAAAARFDAVKFQTHLPEFESTDLEQFRVKVFPQDETRPDYWRRTGFERSQWLELAAHARESGLVFMSSPFSNEAVELLSECEVGAWKVASGEVTNLPMLRRMIETGLPVLVSSGMSGWDELDLIVREVKESNTPLGLFQCTSAYPCPPEKWGLNVVTELQERYGCPVGLSDHSGTVVPSLAAVTLGARMLEVHIAFSKEQFGPDSRASLDLTQARQLVQGVHQLDEALVNPVDKDVQADTLRPLRELFMKSIVAARPLDEGHCLTEADLAIKKPGHGISAWQVDKVIGRRLNHAVPADHFLCDSDLT